VEKTSAPFDDVVERLTEGEVWLCQRLSSEHRAIYRGMRQRLDDYLLDFLAMNIRYFTSHGKKHSLGVIRQLYRLLRDLPAETLAQVTSVEVLILLCSAWLHDVGLLVNRDSAGRPLSDDEIRARHHQLSHDKILEIHGEAGIDNPNLARLIARVCLCHRRSESIEERLPEEQFIQGQRVRSRLLAALLRVSDALDTDWARAPQVLLEKLTDLPDLSKLHWRACQMLEIGYRPAQGEIHLDAAYSPASEMSEDDARRLFLWKFDDLRGEFAGTRQLLLGHGLPYERLTGVLDYPPGRLAVRSDTCLPEAVWPLEAILYDRHRREHKERGEFVFAADWCYQIGRLYERRGDLSRAMQWYNKASRSLTTAREQAVHHRHWWRVLERHYTLKTKEVARETLDDDERRFLVDLDAIQIQLDLVEENLEAIVGSAQLETLHLLLRAGHSPRRQAIRTCLQRWTTKVEPEGTLDHGCTYCTGLGISIWSLSGDQERAEQGLAWLRVQRDREWRVRHNRKTQFNDAAYALVGLLDGSHDPLNDADVESIYHLLTDKQTNWDERRQTSRAESHGIILYALGDYLQRLPDYRSVPAQKAIAERMSEYLDEIESDGLVVLALALRGIAPALILREELAKRAERIKQAVVEGFFWEPKETDIAARIKGPLYRLVASNPEKAAKRLIGWFTYWEFDLLRREWKKGQKEDDPSGNPDL
jgi:hypothetical protein